MKQYSNEPKLYYKPLIPLVNLLLFNSIDNMPFNDNFEEISIDFFEAIYHYNKDDIQYKEYLNKNINIFLDSLDCSKRSNINEIFTTSEIFSYILLSWNVFVETGDHDAAIKKFIEEMNVFMETSVIGYFYYHFICFQVESIFKFDFKNRNTISKEHYFNLLNELCNPKSMDGFKKI